MSGPLVSVIVPTFDSLETLPEALDSIRAQTIGDLEVIVVDDGSTDGTGVYLESVREPRLRVLSQERGGAGAARNAGRAQARGEFLLFSDSDVILEPRFLETMLAALEARPEASYAYCDFAVRRFEGSWRETVFTSRPFDAPALRECNYIGATSLIRAEHCPDWDPAIRSLQDWDVWLTMLDQGRTGTYVSEVLFESIDRRESITQSWSRNHYAEAVADVRSKHEPVLVLSSAPVPEAALEHAGLPRYLLDVRGQDALPLPGEASGARRGYAAVLDEGAERLPDGWLRDCIRLSAYGNGVFAFSPSSEPPFRAAVPDEQGARMLGRRVLLPEGVSGGAGVVPIAILAGFAPAPSSTPAALAAAFWEHAQAQGALPAVLAGDPGD